MMMDGGIMEPSASRGLINSAVRRSVQLVTCIEVDV
jgi:hypothetical protein